MEQLVRVKETFDDGTAMVIHVRESACSGDCHKCSGCGAAKETILLKAENPIGAKRGDLVKLESATGPVLKAAAVLYMLPILLFCARWGFGPAMLVSFTHGIFQMLFAGGISIGWQSMVGDYLLAYAVLGVAGLFKGRFALGTVVGCAARFFVHYVVGATLWAEYMPEEFFGMTMTTPWIYSALYNGAYMALDLVLILVAYVILSKTPLARYFKGEDLK
jgi:thiamine transporter